MSLVVSAAESGSAPWISTDVVRIELPVPGRSDPTSAVNSAVTIPTAAWLPAAAESGSASPNAAAQARKSPARKVRRAEAVSPTAISANVLF